MANETRKFATLKLFEYFSFKMLTEACYARFQNFNSYKSKPLSNGHSCSRSVSTMAQNGHNQT